MHAQQVAATIELCLEVAGLTRQVSDLAGARDVRATPDFRSGTGRSGDTRADRA